MKQQKPLWLREKEFWDWEDDDDEDKVMRMAKMTRLTRLMRTTRETRMTRALHPSLLSRSVDVSAKETS